MYFCSHSHARASVTFFPKKRPPVVHKGQKTERSGDCSTLPGELLGARRGQRGPASPEEIPLQTRSFPKCRGEREKTWWWLSRQLEVLEPVVVENHCYTKM